MARLYSSGFELNSSTNGVELRQWSGATVVSDVPRSGTYAALLDAVNDFFRLNFALTNQADGFYSRSYIRFTSFPVSLTEFINIENVSSVDKVSVRVNSDGTLELWNDEDGAQIGGDSPALLTNVWYRIEVEVDATTISSTALDARINGTSFASGTVDFAEGVVQFQMVALGVIFEARIDDIAINDNNGSFQNTFPGV